MTARLIAEEGDLEGLILTLENSDQWVIGRDPEECQLVIQDPLVSRKHAIAYQKPEGFYIENVSHTNPTQINEIELTGEPHLLQDGDKIRIGTELFRFDSHAPETIQDVQREEPEAESLKQEDEIDKTQDTIFPDQADEFVPSVEIDFGLAEAGRWLLKVVSGPNNGAEFYMQAGQSYIIGTDPKTCDIIFHDNSVSRQHAKIIISPDDDLLIEDLKSRNGILVNGKAVEGTEKLIPSLIVTVGTTSFIIYDREGDMETIISPLLPSIVKILQSEESSSRKEENAADDSPPELKSLYDDPNALPPMEPKPKQKSGNTFLVALLTGVFLLVGLGTMALFRSEPILETVQENANELIQEQLAPYPALKFAYNRSTGGLLLLGHIETMAEKNQLLYRLQDQKFIKHVDDSGIIIDELVWREINSILSNNPAWKGVSITSPASGEFTLSGYLETRKQAEQLSDYIAVNFPYLDLLKKELVVEEEVENQINGLIHAANLTLVKAKMDLGEINLMGSVTNEQLAAVPELITKIKSIPGVRQVNNRITLKSPEMGIINLSSKYEVTGHTLVGLKHTVIINGRILSEGDQLDGMRIKKITPDQIFLEKDQSKYRIDYKS